MLRAIMENEWRTLLLLFDRAYNCNTADSRGGAPIRTEADGMMDVSCMSWLAEGSVAETQ